MSKPRTIIVESCTSRECKAKYKDEINSMCEAVTQPHYYDEKKRTTTCLYCNKENKLPKL